MHHRQKHPQANQLGPACNPARGLLRRELLVQVPLWNGRAPAFEVSIISHPFLQGVKESPANLHSPARRSRRPTQKYNRRIEPFESNNMERTNQESEAVRQLHFSLSNLRPGSEVLRSALRSLETLVVGYFSSPLPKLSYHLQESSTLSIMWKFLAPPVFLGVDYHMLEALAA